VKDAEGRDGFETTGGIVPVAWHASREREERRPGPRLPRFSLTTENVPRIFRRESVGVENAVCLAG